MNWDAIGAIGEILGAAAVVLSLAYLAKQIRGSNRAARRAAEQELFDLMFRVNSQVAGSEGVADIVGRGFQDFESLTPDERARLGSVFYQLTLAWARIDYLAKLGEIDPWMSEHIEAVRRSVVASPGYRAWFQIRRGWYSPDFGAVIDDEAGNAGDDHAYSRYGYGDEA